MKFKIIEDLFESLLQRYQEGLKKSIKGTKFDFDSIDVLYYNLNKKSTINSKNNDEKCLLYTITAALNIEQTESHQERISNVKPFFNQYNWKKQIFHHI